MTDITELAQILKAAANITADAIDRLKAFPGDELIDLSQHEGEQVDIDIATLNQWYELSSPANVLALVEALEKAQQRIAELEEAEQKLCAANVTLDARAELAERRLAEMESAPSPQPPLTYWRSASGRLRQRGGVLSMMTNIKTPNWLLLRPAMRSMPPLRHGIWKMMAFRTIAIPYQSNGHGTHRGGSLRTLAAIWLRLAR
ncbi:ead/Ea22-like family protein [Klebsiella pneumoniae]|nr:ead/Ea22-like family protein [Klebsiella pneumoniae]